MISIYSIGFAYQLCPCIQANPIGYAMPMTDIASLLKQTTSETGAGLHRIDAEFLLSHCMAKPRSWLYAFGDYALSEQQCAEFEALVQRRLLGEPVAYITGRRGFWSFDLQVSPDTLIPRPETELLVDLALARIHPERACHVLDLGTGSGAVALAIAHECPLARVTAVDFSEAALVVARRNAAELKIRNIEWLRSDWYTALEGQSFDVMVSNPPYIEQADAHLQQGDLRFEPLSALASGVDGLDAVRLILAGAQNHLLPQGWLLIEHGWNQGAAIRELFAQNGFTNIQTEQDLELRDRVTLGRNPP
jgi:release factor glutamine methyltransferase